jgi:hypothetical protein
MVIVAALPLIQHPFDLPPYAGRIVIASLERHLCRLLRRLERTIEAVFLNQLIRDDVWVVGHLVFFARQYFGELIASRAAAFSIPAYRPPENRGQSSANPASMTAAPMSRSPR